jgi:AraC-like DNA-binding protein
MNALDTIVFETPIVRAARFRCATTDRRFRDSGPAENCAVVFPRTAVWLRYADAPAFVADPSLATIYNPGQEYTREVISAEGDSCEWFGVTPEIALEIAASFDAASYDRVERPFAPRAAPVDRALYLAQRALFTRLENRTVDRFEAEEAIVSLVTAVIARGYTDAKQSRKSDDARRDLVERAKASLSRSLTDHRGLNELASELGVSPFHLCRVFREHTGSTLHEFKTDLRLRYALGRLTERSADLSRVAYECGFSSHSHFTASMRSKFGHTPSALRNDLTTT